MKGLNHRRAERDMSQRAIAQFMPWFAQKEKCKSREVDILSLDPYLRAAPRVFDLFVARF